MNVLELFSGTKSISKAFERRGHTTCTVDNDPKLEPDICIDVLKLSVDDIPFVPDVVWASPPCQCFSVASMGRNWKQQGYTIVPKSEGARAALTMLEDAVGLILALNPRYFFIENPRAAMRRAVVFRPFRRVTVTYCQYGTGYQKPTDIWTNHMGWSPRPVCKPLAPCHENAPRGSKKGVQGLDGAKERGRIPDALCDEIVLACEKEPEEVWF